MTFIGQREIGIVIGEEKLSIALFWLLLLAVPTFPTCQKGNPINVTPLINFVILQLKQVNNGKMNDRDKNF